MATTSSRRPTRRFGMEAVRRRSSSDPIIRILLLAAVLSLAIGSVHGRQFHRVDRHHMRHYSGDLRRVSGSSGTPCGVSAGSISVNDEYSGQGDARTARSARFPAATWSWATWSSIESGRNRARGRRTGRSGVAAHGRVDAHGRTGGGRNTSTRRIFDPEATYPSNVGCCAARPCADGYGRSWSSTAVGDATEAGRVTEQATVQSDEQTPLQPPADAPLETHRPGRHCAVRSLIFVRSCSARRSSSKGWPMRDVARHGAQQVLQHVSWSRWP